MFETSGARAPDHVRFRRFPLEGVDAMSAHTGRSYPRHAHDEYGVGRVDAGGHSSWSDRGQVEAGPGQFITVNPGEVHDGRPAGAAPRASRILYFAPRIFAALRADVDAGRTREPRLVAPAFAQPGLRGAFEHAFACARDGVTPLAAETALLLFVAALGRQFGQCAIAERTAPAIARARARLDDDPTNAPSLDELAHEAGSTRFQLLRAFARDTGLTPHAYLVQRRLRLARALLRAGRSPADVAVSTGFCDQSHLNRSFRRHYGITPGRYAACR